MNLWKPKRCNCLFWALAMWWRYGGRLVWRWSYVGWWPHVFWLQYGRLFEYVPDEYEYGRLFPPFIFKGHMQEMLTETICKSVVVGGEHQETCMDLTPHLKRKL